MYTTGACVYQFATGGNNLNPKEEVLTNVGLTKNESKVYVALTEIGSTTITKIADKSKVHRVNVYDAVKKLQKRGLINTITKDEKIFYQASDPDMLLNILKEKEVALQSIIPQLQLNQELATTKSDVMLFEGVAALRNIFNSFLEKGVERLTMGVPKNAAEKVGTEFLNAYHKRRAEMKIKMRHIYNRGADERSKFLTSNNLLTEVRFLPRENDSPVATDICGDEVLFTMLGDENQKPIMILIRNKTMADAYRNYFELLWNIAKQ